MAEAMKARIMARVESANIEAAQGSFLQTSQEAAAANAAAKASEEKEAVEMAKGTLRTEGMYRYSRNPQYVADIAIVGGWMILSAAPWVFAVGAPVIAILVVTPFAEERWLKDQYGTAFEDYAKRVRRFF